MLWNILRQKTEREKKRLTFQGESEEQIVSASSFIKPPKEETSAKGVKNVQPTVWQPLGEITSEL